MSIHKSERVYVAYNFNCLIENEGLLKVTGCQFCHVHSNSDNVSEKVHDVDVVTIDY